MDACSIASICPLSFDRMGMGCSFAGLAKARLLNHIRKGCTPPISQQILDFTLTKYWCTKAPSFASGSRSFFLYTGSVKSRVFGTMIGEVLNLLEKGLGCTVA
jgi:hypothetical protein